MSLEGLPRALWRADSARTARELGHQLTDRDVDVIVLADEVRRLSVRAAAPPVTAPQAIERMIAQLGECRELFLDAHQALHRPVDETVPAEERDLVVRAMQLLHLLGERAYLLNCERLGIVPNAKDRAKFLEGWSDDSEVIGGGV